MLETTSSHIQSHNSYSIFNFRIQCSVVELSRCAVHACDKIILGLVFRVRINTVVPMFSHLLRVLLGSLGPECICTYPKGISGTL
jgi:hypothetical protein